jgi:hypothetical protein
VVVALTLFALVMSSLAVATVPMVRGSMKSTGSAQRAAALTRRLNQIQVLPFDALAGRSGCTTIPEPPLPRTECVRVENVSGSRRRVTVVVTPTDGLHKADSVTLERVRPSAGSPFNEKK